MREPMPPGFYNMDCMEAMKQFPDGFFDLAIVDPPYGINVASHAGGKIVGGCKAVRWKGFAEYTAQAGGWLDVKILPHLQRQHTAG